MFRAPFVPCVMLVAAGSVTACTDETSFNDEEIQELLVYRLPDKLPANPSNKYADNLNAAVLGKKFFFDARFSGALGPINDGVTNGSLGKPGDTGKVSCTGCHQLDRGGSDHRSRPGNVSLGVNYGLRNAPSVVNATYSDAIQLWDGRKDSLWSVALGPFEGANEHNGTRLAYAHLIYDKYKAEYEAVFGALPDLTDTARFPAAGKPGQMAFDTMAADDKVAISTVYANMGKAIEAYERQLVSVNFQPSPFDKQLAVLAGADPNSPELAETAAMTPGAIRGARLFIGKAACNECHRGPTFTDFKFHNIGCPQEGEFVASIDTGRSSAVTRAMADPFRRDGIYSDAMDAAPFAAIQAAATDAKAIGSFKTPSLRNVAKTGPFMHNGVYGDLWTVMDHYNFGGRTGQYSGTKESTISPLLLSADELNDLVEFLESLSDGPAKTLPAFPEGLVGMPTLP